MARISAAEVRCSASVGEGLGASSEGAAECSSGLDVPNGFHMWEKANEVRVSIKVLDWLGAGCNR